MLGRTGFGTRAHVLTSRVVRVRVTRHVDGSYLLQAHITPDQNRWRIAHPHPAGAWLIEPLLHPTPDAAGCWFAASIAAAS
jgi:hypothetical protein